MKKIYKFIKYMFTFKFFNFLDVVVAIFMTKLIGFWALLPFFVGFTGGFLLSVYQEFKKLNKPK